MNFSLLSFQLGNIYLSWDLIINRNRLGGLIYNLYFRKFLYYYYYYYYYIYIPWIIRDKVHLDIGIVNIDMDATKQMYIKYEYNYGIRKQIIVRS